MDSAGMEQSPPTARPSRRAFLGVAGGLGVAGAAARILPASATGVSGGSARSAASSATRATLADAPVPLVPFAGADGSTSPNSAINTMLNGGIDVNHQPFAPVGVAPTAIRWYMDEVTFPNPLVGYYSNLGWPDFTQRYGIPAHGLVSIRPDLATVNRGDFDGDLVEFMLSAPAGPTSLLTLWHEIATMTFGNPNYPSLHEAPAYRDALVRVYWLARESGANVKVGAVNVRPGMLMPANYLNAGLGSTPQEIYNMWMPANLDWYGCDLYDSADWTLSARDELDLFQTCANNLASVVNGELVPSHPNANYPINIPEINSPVIDPKNDPLGQSTIWTSGPTGFRRSDFFRDAWNWLENNSPASHCTGLLGFWNGKGNLGTIWPPQDNPPGSRAVMFDTLKTINGNSYP